MKLTAYFDAEDYQAIRLASMQGKFGFSFQRSGNGEVTFTTQDPRKLCGQLSKIVDFGETTAAEVFGLR